MFTMARLICSALTIAIVVGNAGCCFVPKHTLRQCKRQSYYLSEENGQLMSQVDNANQMVQAVTTEKNQLAQHSAQLEQQLAIANERYDNMKAERSELKQRYVGMLRGSQGGLSGDLAERFRELSEKYPNFEFDPETGVSKFHADILFSTGSAIVNKSAYALLNDFSEIMNSSDARDLNILVVGHTDDKRIIKRATASKHASNWHLSTNRANSVALLLEKSGVSSDRMGVAGHNKFQPVASNTSESNRRLNRRVEIFILAPDARVAGWEKRTSRN